MRESKKGLTFWIAATIVAVVLLAVVQSRWVV